MRRHLLIALAAAPGLWPLAAPGALVWRPGEGWTNEGADAGGDVAANSRDQLEASKKLEQAGNWKGAKASYGGLVRKWPFSFHAGEAQFKIGFCSEQQADFPRAFKEYQKCIEKYPASEFFEKALERQYNIANLFLSGEPQRVWKMPLPPSWEQTAKMYEQIIKNAPYGRYAAEAQFKIGLCDEKTKKWSEAIQVYNTVLDRYPGNDIADDAQYQIGYVWFQAAERPDYDQGAAEKAIQAFNEFIAQYPNSDKVPQAKENLATVHGRLTQGSFNIAKFYESQKRPDAAVIYYREVVQKAPDSDMARIAREKIAELTPMNASGPPTPKDLGKLQERAAEAAAKERERAAGGGEMAEAQQRIAASEPLPEGEAVGPAPERPAPGKPGQPAAGDVALRQPRPAPEENDAENEMIGPVLPEPVAQ